MQSNKKSHEDSLEKERLLTEKLLEKVGTGEVVDDLLSTDERVLARVTDGIYRQPSSAIRELVANAYDADATTVRIDTDYPRFNTITIRDDGNGMTFEALANMIRHIGGSAKRNASKTALGVVNSEDPTLSVNKKRKVIGKIGIGLFSVAQLTRDFKIITKTSGSNYYIEADIRLYNYSEQLVNEYAERGEDITAGEVSISSRYTSNLDAHGTDIILTNVKRSAKDQLRSVDVWYSVLKAKKDGQKKHNKPPEYHIGCIEEDSDLLIQEPAKLPWSRSDDSDSRMEILYDKLTSLAGHTTSPKYEEVLDNYLQMIWTVALSVPLPYLKSHPFSLSGEDFSSVYVLHNKPGQFVNEVKLEKSDTIRDKFGMKTKEVEDDFRVYIDGIRLYRPIKFTDIRATNAAVKDPLMFIGKVTPDMSIADKFSSGGDLDFEAYIQWCPRVVPKEHNGVLLRIHDASGILFDSSFMKYQVAEHVIKGQLIAEIFVNKGLEAALNIDRESFNIAHPHYQIISRWLHEAIRQVINKYKSIKKGAISKRRTEEQSKFKSYLSRVVEEIAAENEVDVDDIQDFIFEDEDQQFEGQTRIRGLQGLGINLGAVQKRESKERFRALLQVLQVYGVLDSIHYSEQDQFISDLALIVLKDKES